MSIIINWIKANKLTFVLILIVLYFIFNKYSSSLSYQMTPLSGGMGGGYETGLSMKTAPGINSMMRSDIIPPIEEAPPKTDLSNRLVISESYLSLMTCRLAKSVVGGAS